MKKQEQEIVLLFIVALACEKQSSLFFKLRKEEYRVHILSDLLISNVKLQITGFI